ncbi:MAG: lipoprotein [Pseudomonadota bacterium]
MSLFENSQPLRTALVVIVTAIGLSACGVKGPLENPTAPAAATPDENTIIEGDTTEEKPRERIILDGLLE